jgi:hypothetical protein
VNTTKPILLVDDNPMDVDVTVLAFKQSNLVNPIQVARDGEEALALIPRWEDGEPKPVFILLDSNMPKVSGLEVLQALKAHPALRAIPVVMLTTSSANRDVHAAPVSCPAISITGCSASRVNLSAFSSRLRSAIARPSRSALTAGQRTQTLTATPRALISSARSASTDSTNAPRSIAPACISRRSSRE